MDIDYDKIDDCTLALLYLVTSVDKYGAGLGRGSTGRP
jgi:hypothetical protein